MSEDREVKMIDINAPEVVEIEVLNGTLWVNVDGLCRLRVCRIPEGRVRMTVPAGTKVKRTRQT